jgi:hypothetical protein
MTVCERVFRELKFELPSTHVRRFSVTESLVEDPGARLKELLAKIAREDMELMSNLVTEFARRFEETHKLKLVFSEEAVQLLVEESAKSSRSVRDLCAVKFKDFQFGLRLIAQNTGQKEFTIDREIVAAPDKRLSEWVVKSYQKEGTTGPDGD